MTMDAKHMKKVPHSGELNGQEPRTQLYKLWSAMQLTRSERNARSQISRERSATTLEKVLNLSCGLVSKSGLGGHVGRASPSAGALYPTVIYTLELQEEEGVFFLYRYVAATGDIDRLSVTIPQAVLAGRFGLPEEVRTVFLFVADVERSMRKYGRRGIFYAMLDTAHAFCNLHVFLNSVTRLSWVLEDVPCQMVQALAYSIPVAHLPIAALATSDGFPWKTRPARAGDPASPVCGIDNGTEFGSPDWVARNVFSGGAGGVRPTAELPVDWRDIFRRKSAECFSGRAIELDRVRAILRGLEPLNGFDGLELRLALRRTEYTADLFRVSLSDGVVVPTRSYSTWDIVDTCMGQSFLGDAGAALAIYVPEHRTGFFEDPDAFRCSVVNAGYLAQQIYLKAAQEGLGVCAIGGYSESDAQRLMRLSAREPVLYLAALGGENSGEEKADRGAIAFSHGERTGSAKGVQ